MTTSLCQIRLHLETRRRELNARLDRIAAPAPAAHGPSPGNLPVRGMTEVRAEVELRRELRRVLAMLSRIAAGLPVPGANGNTRASAAGSAAGDAIAA